MVKNLNTVDRGTSIRIGAGSGNINQGDRTVAIGYGAGYDGQNNYAIAIGSDAGSSSQNNNAVAVGSRAGNFNQGTRSIAIGYSAGKGDVFNPSFSQGSSSVAIGDHAGEISLGSNAIAIGAYSNANNNSICLNASGLPMPNADKENAFYVSSIRYNNLTSNILARNPATNEIIDVGPMTGGGGAVGNLHQVTTTGNVTTNTIEVPEVNFNTNVILSSDLNNSSVRIGYQSGLTDQSSNSVAIGNQAGKENQGINSVALGVGAGYENLSLNAIAIGNNAGYINQGINSVALGVGAGYEDLSSNAIAIGTGSGTSNSNNIVSIGTLSGSGENSVSIGFGAGYSSKDSSNTVSIGFESGNKGTLEKSIAVGYRSGYNNQRRYCIAIGSEAGYYFQGIYKSDLSGYNDAGCIAIGMNSGRTSQYPGAISIGKNSGNINQNTNSVAIGNGAGLTNQGAQSIALGYKAGETNQHDNTIILNSSGNALDSTSSSGFYVSPIREVTPTSSIMESSNVLVHTPDKEIINLGLITSAVIYRNLTPQSNVLNSNTYVDYPNCFGGQPLVNFFSVSLGFTQTQILSAVSSNVGIILLDNTGNPITTVGGASIDYTNVSNGTYKDRGGVDTDKLYHSGNISSTFSTISDMRLSPSGGSLIVTSTNIVANVSNGSGIEIFSGGGRITTGGNNVVAATYGIRIQTDLNLPFEVKDFTVIANLLP
jgi:hypothetical protein